MNSTREVTSMSKHNQCIYIIDEDVRLLKKLGNLITETYQGYEVVAMTSTKDARDEIRGTRPSVVITSLEFEDPESDPYSLLKFIRSVQLTKDIPIIVTGTRNVLEESSDRLKKYDVEYVPKSIRIPFFMGVLKSCIHSSKTTDAKIIHLKEGEVLFKEGDSSDSLYYLKSGGLLVYKTSHNKTVEIAEINDQQLIGEMAYMEKTLRSASIKASEDSEVWELQIGDFESFIEEQPFWLKLLMKTLLDRLRDSNNKILQLTNK